MKFSKRLFIVEPWFQRFTVGCIQTSTVNYCLYLRLQLIIAEG